MSEFSAVKPPDQVEEIEKKEEKEKQKNIGEDEVEEPPKTCTSKIKNGNDE